MSRQVVNVLGFSSNENQFVVKSQNFSVKINNQIVNAESEHPSPIEYLLSGIAGSINATGQIVAKELNMDLKSIQIEIKGSINTAKASGLNTKDRSGFETIDLVVKPVTTADLTTLKFWMDEIKERCPIYDNLLNTTPINLVVTKDYNIKAA